MFHGSLASRARRHIQEIRNGFDLGTSGPSRHVANLERALNILSDQLYQKPTHFLLELIQNADDNDYQVANPAVTFTYTEKRLRIDCNETGFTEANVEAICQIGHSTKAGRTETTRYIGEKGIGFKSVFKVADRVWISSNAYTFKFDKSQPLGMIAPMWEAFPLPIIPGVTSMLLELSPSYDPTQLVKQLMDLDARMLIFLKKVCEINVQVNLAGCEPWRTILKKSERVAGSESTIMLQQDSRSFAYMISKHTVENMPVDPKREGQTRSEILLAFPVINKQEEELERQQVYAFLPIRDYGFKFLLQADFLLSASREDILSDSPWNTALRDFFVDSFVGLVKGCQDNFLHYDWPLFLPIETFRQDFFESARLPIIQRLRSTLTVRNSLDTSVNPQGLLQIPEQFRADTGYPLLAFKSTSSLFLSDKYGPNCLESLEKLGVKKMELSDFVKILQKVLTTDGIEFRRRSSIWHSEFARHLLAALLECNTDRSQWEVVQELSIVPLEGDEWISPAKAIAVGVFLPPETEDGLQLEGLDIKLIPNEAASDQARKSLYKHLGISTINQSEMCHYIANSLCREGRFPQTISTDKLVSQTIFLYKAGWRNPSGQDMWFHTQTGSIDRGSQLYLESSEEYSVSHYVNLRKEFYLSVEYIDAVRKLSIRVRDFQSWLEDCLHVWKLPRLLKVTATSKASPRILLSSEFSGRAHSTEAPPRIYLLRDNFRKYSMFFSLEEMFKNKFYARKLGPRTAALEANHKAFIAAVGRLQVKCIGNHYAELKETYLPHPGVREDTNGRIALLDVSDPEHPDWQYLKRFGLGVEPDLKMYLRCLERLSLVPSRAISRSEVEQKVARYLDQIQARYTEDTNMVKQFFTQKAVVRVPPINSVSGYGWVKVTSCLWDGGCCFRLLPVLKRQYPGNETLFRKVLGCREATLMDLYREATLLRLGDDLEHITDIFYDIEQRLRDEQIDPNNCFGQFASNDIFPITSGGRISSSRHGYDKLCKVKPTVEWFIADSENLRRSFENLLPLLAFNVRTVRHLKKTMERMKLDRYRLSRCAKSRAETDGVSTFDPRLSQDLLRRIPYILRLVPSMISMKTKRRIARQLRSLKVFLTDYLTQEWSVTVGDGQVIKGRPYQVNVVFVTEKEETLHVFLSSKYVVQSVCKNDIVQQFADFCEIRDHTHLLNMALWESQEEVEITFQDYGIPEYDPLIDTEGLLGEDSDDAEDTGPEDLQFTLNPGDTLNGRGLGEDTEGIRHLDGTMSSSQSWSESTRVKYQGNRIGADGFNLDDHEETMSPTHIHLIRHHSRFAVVELQDIFGVCKLDDKRIDQKTQPPSSQPRPPRSLPGFIKILGSSSRKAAAKETSPTVRVDDPDLQYKGENFFSTILTQALGNSYEPNRHWTSILRTQDRHKPFEGSSATHATFTLPDDSGLITGIMLGEHLDLARLWKTEPPTWHFEVETTAGGLDTTFYLTNAQIDRIRAFSISSLSEVSQIPKNVSVLVRIFNLDASNTPSANLYRDPWEMFLTGEITIKADTVYRCGVRHESESSETSSNTPTSHLRTGVGGIARSRGMTDNSEAPPPYA